MALIKGKDFDKMWVLKLQEEKNFSGRKLLEITWVL